MQLFNGPRNRKNVKIPPGQVRFCQLDLKPYRRRFGHMVPSFICQFLLKWQAKREHHATALNTVFDAEFLVTPQIRKNRGAACVKGAADLWADAKGSAFEVTQYRVLPAICCQLLICKPDKTDRRCFPIRTWTRQGRDVRRCRSDSWYRHFRSYRSARPSPRIPTPWPD